ncbi:late promoter transcription accessory protein [Acinetobacter phage vB_AbaM_PhT2]|uniref:Late transcription coactivator n=2 Tax=Hadassahvirus TaxID=2842716 RepID=A0A6B9SXU1_9CAUD|nr:late promoter transcriptional regulator [Acinetobacter phage AbTZA1]YP_009887117.1 late promoter transcriptional regulator [Acinetobacter phage vB_AbaM_PhT2]QQM13980.1 late promoter transcription accessory protein [Acinetobacter phage Maestro]QQM18733.1 late promoter transcription accessory protein [Acinetobacter phage Morttis]QQO96435.1 late transcription coactivator [Acinetobacter phage Minot]QQO96684.1 late transcription coactivator [Acinetobacter phage Mokit]UQS94313.1 late promoter tr
MQSLENNLMEVLQQKTAAAYDKQTTSAEITALVNTEGLSYLEAVSWWMEERSIPENQFAKYIPETIIEQLKSEALDDNLLKPSMAKQNKYSTLDFMYG